MKVRFQTRECSPGPQGMGGVEEVDDAVSEGWLTVGRAAQATPFLETQGHRTLADFQVPY